MKNIKLKIPKLLNLFMDKLGLDEDFAQILVDEGLYFIRSGLCSSKRANCN